MMEGPVVFPSLLDPEVSTSADIAALQAQVSALQSQAASAGKCPEGYAWDRAETGFTLCKRGADEVVKVGDFWVDRDGGRAADTASPTAPPM